MSKTTPEPDISGTFMVQRVVIHSVPKARLAQKDEVEQTLADLPVALTPKQADYFRKRIVTSLAKHFQVVHDPDSASPVPHSVVKFFAAASMGEDEFVDMSRDIARYLHLKQPGGSNAGLAAVIEGTVGAGAAAGKCLVVLKLEQESGVHFEQKWVGDKLTYTVTLEDVTMTDKTKVFKAALFERCDSVASLRGRLSDDQLSDSVLGREIAEFFLSSFLGCKLLALPKIVTKQAVERINEFINEQPEEERAGLGRALRVELESNDTTLNVEAWAQKHLPVDRQDELVNRFRLEDGSVPIIPKDDEMVRPLFHKMVVEYSNGVRVSGPPPEVESAVQALRAAMDDKNDPLFRGTVRKLR